MFSIASGFQLQKRHPSLFLCCFFLKFWYVMFLLAVYSRSNSRRTLMPKETSRHFSFSVFFSILLLYFASSFGRKSTDFLFIWNQSYSGLNCLFCLQAERWKLLHLAINKYVSAYICMCEQCIIWAFHPFFSEDIYVLAKTIPASDLSSLRNFQYFQTLACLLLYPELSPSHWLPILIKVKFQLIFIPGCDTE